LHFPEQIQQELLQQIRLFKFNKGKQASVPSLPFLSHATILYSKDSNYLTYLTKHNTNVIRKHRVKQE